MNIKKTGGLVVPEIGILVLILCLVLPLCAQEITGSISGVALDPTGAVVPGVKVTVLNTKTNVSTVVSTGPSGAYRVPFLIFGTYRVSGELAGFKTTQVDNVTVSTNEEARVDLNMAVGQVTEVLNVAETALSLKTEEASVATTISSDQIEQLPLLGRQIIGATLLAPGAYMVNNNSKAQRDSGFVRRNGLSLSVNGLTDLSNKFYYDGIEGMNFDAGSRAFDPSLEAVQEVKVQVNSNSAEYGGAAGASVNIVTKAGTNEFHGHVYDYLQNDKLNAYQEDTKTLRANQIANNQFVSSNKPVVRNNIFGGGIGGPIIKDRFFFFANYEGGRGIRSGAFGQITVPTVQMRNGDFSQLVASSGCIKDPLNISANGTVGCFPDPKNMSRFMDPTSLKVLALTPLPTNGNLVNNFQGPVRPAGIRTDEIITRFDFRISDRDSFYGRYIHNFNNDYVGYLFPLFGPGSSDRGYKRKRHNQNISLSETHTFSSNIFNEVRAGWNRSLTFEELETSFKNDITGQLGLTSQLPETKNPLEWGPPNFSISQSASDLGLPGLRTGMPWNPNGGQIWQFADNLSIIHGKHSFKTGFTLMRRNDVFIETLTGRGGLNFGSAAGGSYTGDGLVDFMLGYMSEAVVGISPLHGTPNQFWYGGYFQDDYKVTNSLTLNLGVRYDYFQPWKERHDHWAGFDLNANQIEYAATATAAEGGRALQFGDNKNLGPRFGFAWRPMGRQNTVIRGGYGVYYEQEHPSGPINNAVNPPPGGPYAANADTSGFGFARDFIAPALSVNPRPTLFWNNFALGTGNVGARVSLYTGDPHMKNTMVQQWNMAVQHRRGNNLFEVAYVANKANHIFTSENVNLPGDFNSLHVLGTGAYIRSQYAAITWRQSDGSGEYHSLQTKYERRAKGAVFLFSYTLGHALSDAEQGQSAVGVGNPGTFHFLSNRHLDKSSTTFDIRQRFTSSIVYDIPYRTNQQGVLGKVLGAWQTNLLFTAQTGNATQVSDGTGLATSYSRFDRPDMVANPNLPTGDRTQTRYFNTDAFQVVTDPRFGTAPRMMVRQPGLWNPDIVLTKTFNMTERFHLVFRADAYNAFNHPNWGSIDTTIRNVANPNIGPPGTLKNPYGRVISFGPERYMQMSLKLQF